MRCCEWIEAACLTSGWQPLAVDEMKFRMNEIQFVTGAIQLCYYGRYLEGTRSRSSTLLLEKRVSIECGVK